MLCVRWIYHSTCQTYFFGNVYRVGALFCVGHICMPVLAPFAGHGFRFNVPWLLFLLAPLRGGASYVGINLARIFKLMMLNGCTKNTKYACRMQATVSSCRCRVECATTPTATATAPTATATPATTSTILTWRHSYTKTEQTYRTCRPNGRRQGLGRGTGLSWVWVGQQTRPMQRGQQSVLPKKETKRQTTVW